MLLVTLSLICTVLQVTRTDIGEGLSLLCNQFIENNWRTGHHSIQRILCRSEASKGVYCLQYDEQKIVSGLRDNTIKVRFLIAIIY